MGSKAESPRKLGRYELVCRIATGGMGEVHLARLKSFEGVEKVVAIKILLSRLASTEEFVAMFVNEARVASQILHPNVCQVHELGFEDGQLFICMEFIKGVPLLQLLATHSERAPIADRIATGAIVQACAGLHFAHELKNQEGQALEIVHRDVSPSNLMITSNGLVKVLDFGVVKARQSEYETRTGALKGKYGYMSPEQVDGVRIDRRSDVFALGVVLFEMLTNKQLFSRQDDFQTLQALCEMPIPSIRVHQPRLSRELAEVVAKALSRDRDARYQTAKELGQALTEVMRPKGGIADSEELAEFVSNGYSDFLASADTMLRDARMASKVGRRAGVLEPERAVEFDSSSLSGALTIVEPPLEVEHFRAEHRAEHEHRVEPITPPQARAGGTLRVPLLAAALVALAAAGIFVVWSSFSGHQEESGALVYRGELRAQRPGAGELPTPAIRPSLSTQVPSCAEEAEMGARNRCYLGRDWYRFAACLDQHPLDPLEAPALGLSFALSDDGSVQQVEVQPASVASTELGTCVKEVAQAVKFGPQRGNVRFRIPLQVRRY